MMPMMPLRCSLRGCNSRGGTVTRAAGEGPREAGIDGQCESAREADSRCNDSRRRCKEASALRHSWRHDFTVTRDQLALQDLAARIGRQTVDEYDSPRPL